VRIPDSKIDEIRSAADIVDIISSYLALKKRGKNYVGLCPFHQEKTPSFNVSPDRQMYHCFGCGVGGNVFTFLMELDKVSFVESVRTIAERVGVSLPEEGRHDDKRATENEALFNVCQIASRHFKHNLLKTVEGKLALEYFYHRGFTDETIETFALGYAMNSWDDLTKHAENERVSLPLLEKAGLAVRRDDGSGAYDRFRGRAVFPFFSPTGRIVGFGARKMREDDTMGKYINSPETPIYIKSKTLYGLFQSKEAIRQKEYAILVEGYADLITPYQAGIKNIVASSGTALTSEQIQLIGRYAKNITIVYDADSAGSKAAMRGVDLIIEQGLDVKVASLPAGEDPDTFVREKGVEAFDELLDQAVSFLDFKTTVFQERGMLSTPEGQAEAVRSIVETIAKIPDQLKRGLYIKHVAEKYGLYESTLHQELEKLSGKNRQRVHVAETQRRAEIEESTRPAREAPRVPTLERDLVKLMLEHGPEMATAIFENCTPEEFSDSHIKQVNDIILRYLEEGKEWDVAAMINDVDDEQMKHFIADIVFNKYELSTGWSKQGAEPPEPDPWVIAEHCLVLMRTREIDALIADNHHRMKEAKAQGGSEREFSEYNQTLLQEKKDLETHGVGLANAASGELNEETSES